MIVLLDLLSLSLSLSLFFVKIVEIYDVKSYGNCYDPNLGLYLFSDLVHKAFRDSITV